MRKIFASLAFAFIVAAAPVPGQTTKPTTDTKSDAKGASGDHKRPPAELATKGASVSAKKQNNTADQSYEDVPKSVRVTEFSPLPSGKDWMDKTAFYANLILAAIAIAGVILAYNTLKAIQAQITEMQNSGKQADTHLRLTQRPWVYPDATLASGLTVNPNGSINCRVDIHVSNYGNSPAVGISMHPAFHVTYKADRDVIEERMRLCKQTSLLAGWGSMLFPGGIHSYSENWGFSADAKDIERGTVDGTFYPISVIVCVAYRSTIDPNARHYTGRIYDLRQINPSDPRGAPVAIRYGESISLERLRLTPSMVFGPIIG
jgi:hypothetical protein